MAKSLSVVQPNDKVDQLRRQAAAEPIESAHEPVEPPAHFSTEQAAVFQAIVAGIRTVYDPELPVNLYDLGLIYAIDLDEQNNAAVTMTLTAPGCPVAGELVGQVERQTRDAPGVQSARVSLVFDPPWGRERMSEAALLELGLV